MSEQLIVGHVPVFHSGYLDVLKMYPDADIGVLNQEILLKRFDYLRKDIRALEPYEAVNIMQGGFNRNVVLIGELGLRAALNHSGLVMFDDDVSHSLAKEFDVQPTFAPVFLRWDRENSVTNQEIVPDRTVYIDSDDPLIAELYKQSDRSTNWWRHVAAGIVRDNDMVAVAHNSSVPTAYSSAIEGDPRIISNRGSSIEVSIDIHAEARVIAELAKRGVSTESASIYVTTFPCPNCAKLIAEAGLKKCYFIEGYAMLDGQTILKSNGVEVIKINTNEHTTEPGRLKAYPSQS